MSVQTELDRLNTAKSNLKTAIEGKGVAVPDGTTLDGYSVLVEQISSGGDSVAIVDFLGLTQDSPNKINSQDTIDLLSSDNVVYIRVKGNRLIPKVFQNNKTVEFAIVVPEDPPLFLHAILNLSSKTIFLLENEIVFTPASTSSDNGKFLTVINGKPAWQSLPIYTGEVE